MYTVADFGGRIWSLPMRSALCLLIAGVSCGGSNSATSGPPGAGGSFGAIPESDYAQTAASSFCAAIGACCESHAIPFDAATCEQNTRAGITANIARNSALRVNYDANAAGACVSALTNAAQTCTFSGDAASLNARFNDCGQVFVGELSPGQPCSDPSECTGVLADCGEGACTAAVHGAAGQGCLGSCVADSCTPTPGAPTQPVDSAVWCFADEGLYCSPAFACTAFAAIGQPCSAGGCVDGAFCNAGVCAAEHSTGSCAAASDACSSQSYCDASAQCQLKHPSGAVCAGSVECESDNCALSGGQGTCATTTIAQPQTCAGM
jgi:hypothetical protein